MPAAIPGVSPMPAGWGRIYLDRFVWEHDTGLTLWPEIVRRCFLARTDGEAGEALREQLGNGGHYHTDDWMGVQTRLSDDTLRTGAKGMMIEIGEHRELWRWPALGAIARLSLRGGRWPNAGQYHIRYRYWHIAEYGTDSYPRYDPLEAWLVANLNPTCYPPDGAWCLIQPGVLHHAPTVPALVGEPARQLALF